MWLDHRVDIPATALRDGPWVVGPVLLVIVISGTALATTTRIAAGTVLLAIATAGSTTWPAASRDRNAQHLTKRYGGTIAADDLNFTVSAGQVTWFIGPHESGKSTTFGQSAGLDAPTSSDVIVGGVSYG